MIDCAFWFLVAIIMVLSLANSYLTVYRRGVRRGYRTRQKVELYVHGDAIVDYLAPPNIDVEIIKAESGDKPDATPAKKGGAE